MGGAGVVVARGGLVQDIEVGDHAGVKWINGSCLVCDFCQQSDEPLCPKALLSGYTVDGSFQQYAIAKAAHVARLDKDTPLDAVAPVLCAGITVYKGLKESGASPGQSVAYLRAPVFESVIKMVTIKGSYVGNRRDTTEA